MVHLLMSLDGIQHTKKKNHNVKPLREGITRELRERIYSGYLPPGYKFVESDLAEDFGISRTPVREAIHQLESEGLVTILPNKGAIVNALSIEEIEEIYIIYGALAGTAASLSAELISEDELKQLEACEAKLEAISDTSDRKEYFVLNNEFHSTFLRPCRKRLLLKQIKNCTRQVGRYWYLLLSHSKNMESFSAQHKKILEAFRSRDSKLARETVEEHAKFFGKIVVEALRSISAAELHSPSLPEGKQKIPSINSLFVFGSRDKRE
jgi:DNA-binding GntR family transcriptional regulator